MAEAHEIQRHPPFTTYVPEREMLVTTTTDEHDTITTIFRGHESELHRGVGGPYLVVLRTAAGPVPQIVQAAQEQHEEIVQAVREGREDEYRRAHGFPRA